MHRTLARRLLRIAAVAAALVVGAGAAGYAGSALTAPDTTTIHACRNTENGLLRMLVPNAQPPSRSEDSKSSTSCRQNETAVSWNVQGPVGPQGATGPQGPAGPPGPAGTGGALTSFDALANLDCTLNIPGAPAPVPGKIGISWIVTPGDPYSLAGWHATPTFSCNPVIGPPPPKPCPSVANGTATCAANDGVITTLVCNAGYYQPPGRDPALGCAPNSRTNGSRATAIDLGTVTCNVPGLPAFGDSIAGAGDEAWYLIHISMTAGCPSMIGATWTNASGTLAYDVYGSLGGGSLLSLAVNQTGDYPLSSLGLPGFTGTATAYLRIHEAGASTVGGSFAMTVSTQ